MQSGCEDDVPRERENYDKLFSEGVVATRRNGEEGPKNLSEKMAPSGHVETN